MDIIGSLAGLIFLIAIFPFVGLAIKLESQGPIIIGLDRVSAGKNIKLYKFRSMVIDAAEQKEKLLARNERNDGPFFKIRNDPRVTRVGKVIRRFRLDEVPQFINVFKNEISLVGPRPYSPEEIAAYPDTYAYLAKIKAGLTGLSQVSGSSMLSFQKTLELDAYYVQHQSILLDLAIIGKTIAIMLFDHSAV